MPNRNPTEAFTDNYMDMSKNQEYAANYAEFAMEQMRRYGIPASVTLAQGILESSNGQSRLAKNENNHFGIKATSAWIAGGGRYGIYTDDRPNEKFYNPQIEMFARFKMKSSFHKTKRII